MIVSEGADPPRAIRQATGPDGADVRCVRRCDVGDTRAGRPPRRARGRGRQGVGPRQSGRGRASWLLFVFLSDVVSSGERRHQSFVRFRVVSCRGREMSIGKKRLRDLLCSLNPTCGASNGQESRAGRRRGVRAREGGRMRRQRKRACGV